MSGIRYLTALFDAEAVPLPNAGSGVLPTPAQSIAGRFFFIHQAQAIRDDTRLTACEFLHSTFGEFLVARLIVRELADLAVISTTVTTGRTRKAFDDGFMRVPLSFAPLTTRGKILDFLTALLQSFSDEDASLIRGLLLTAFHDSLRIRDWGHHGYGPLLSAPACYAAYSALLLLTVLVGGPVMGRELFQEPRPPGTRMASALNAMAFPIHGGTMEQLR